VLHSVILNKYNRWKEMEYGVQNLREGRAYQS